MSDVLKDWLTAFHPLPIEGIGTLQWQRFSAELDATGSSVSAPRWSLHFTTESDTGPMSDFFDRLSRFSLLPVHEVQRQYQEWLTAVRKADAPVSIWGAGVLSKQADGAWQFKGSDFPSGPAASLSVLPLISTAPRAGWDLLSRVALVVGSIALGWVIWSGQQQGFRSTLIRSQYKLPIQSAASVEPYQEIR